MAHDTGTVVSAKAAWSGTAKRATPAAFVVTVPATEFVPSPVAFQTARLKDVFGGSPPMLYASGASGEAVFKFRPRVSSPTTVSSPFGPAYATSSFSGVSSEVAPPRRVRGRLREAEKALRMIGPWMRAPRNRFRR